jgi:hypothetical protein
MGYFVYCYQEDKKFLSLLQGMSRHVLRKAVTEGKYSSLHIYGFLPKFVFMRGLIFSRQ